MNNTKNDIQPQLSPNKLETNTIMDDKIYTYKSPILNISYKKGIETCNFVKLLTNTMLLDLGRKIEKTNYELLLWYLNFVAIKKCPILLKYHVKQLPHIDINEVNLFNLISINKYAFLKQYKVGIYPVNIAKHMITLFSNAIKSQQSIMFFKNIEITNIQCTKYSKREYRIIKARGRSTTGRIQLCRIVFSYKVIQ